MLKLKNTQTHNRHTVTAGCKGNKMKIRGILYIIKISHSSSNGRLFPEIAPGQGPSPVKYFIEA